MFNFFFKSQNLFLKTTVKPCSYIYDIDFITKRWAGHSKWSNIKHTKMAKDLSKSWLFSKISRKIKIAAKEGENPDINPKLRAALEEAKQANMPNTTIKKALQNAKSSADKPYWLIYSNPDGLRLGFEVESANPASATSHLNQYCKRINLKVEKRGSDFYEEIGIVIGKPKDIENSYEKALEDAIDVDAQEVSEREDKSLVFECLPNHIDRVCKLLSDKGYEILTATTEITFHNSVKISKKEMEAVASIKERIINNFEDLLRTSDNIEEAESS